MNYWIFVLGYDLLHNVLDRLACDDAYELCVSIYSHFLISDYNDLNKSEYMCLSRYINANMDHIKKKVEELK